MPVRDLWNLARQASSLYRIAGKERKTDGSYRIFLDAKFPLKTIHGRIQAMILSKVIFPTYLQGGIRDRVSPRGQAANAALHLKQRVVVTEDIENFYPSVSNQVVFEIWHGFFRFPPDVAECLTLLTTKDSSLPQGAKTSTLLANLVFWKSEFALVVELEGLGIVYSRLIDDITCSSNRDLSSAETSWLIWRIHALVRPLGFRLKPRKQTIGWAGDRRVATKLVVNDKISLRNEDRSRIRAVVNGYVATANNQNTKPERTYESVSGQVAYLSQHHSIEGQMLRSRLQATKLHSSMSPEAASQGRKDD